VSGQWPGVNDTELSAENESETGQLIILFCCVVVGLLLKETIVPGIIEYVQYCRITSYVCARDMALNF